MTPTSFQSIPLLSLVSVSLSFFFPFSVGPPWRCCSGSWFNPGQRQLFFWIKKIFFFSWPISLSFFFCRWSLYKKIFQPKRRKKEREKRFWLFFFFVSSLLLIFFSPSSSFSLSFSSLLLTKSQLKNFHTWVFFNCYLTKNKQSFFITYNYSLWFTKERIKD